MAARWTLRGERVVLADGVRRAAVQVADGRIDRIAEHDDTVGEVVDVGDLPVLPGLVDPHVHVNDPGRSDWEGFATATRAAAAGGTTTIVDMPLNSLPPTTSADALATKRAAADGRCAVDVGFWGGIVPGNADELDGLLAAGVWGCKAFLVDSGVPEFPPVDLDRLRRDMPRLARAGVPLLVHAESADAMHDAQDAYGRQPPEARRAYAHYLASRPAGSEDTAVEGVIAAVADTGAAAHVLHLSSATALPAIAAAQRRGLAVTAETCPHYLALAAEDVPTGATEFKCAPPIRDRANNERLWQGLVDGTIAFVASDHSPCTPELKHRGHGDFATAWGGIASLQLRLPLLWEQARTHGLGPTEALVAVARWLATAPAAFVGLAHKGRIAPGVDADLVVFDPDASWVVDPDRLEHRHPVTPYAGRRLHGVVRATWLRGELVHDGSTIVRPDAGRALLRQVVA
jgi:allantoinase